MNDATPLFAAKAIGVAILLKASLMAAVVMLLGATTFVESTILVLISSTATGIFGLLIVLVQVRSERALHRRMDEVEDKADERTKTLVEKIEGNGTAASAA